MEKDITNLTEVARSVQLLKIDGFSILSNTMSASDYIKSTWNVGGYDWEVKLYPGYSNPINGNSWVVLKLLWLSEASEDTVRASLGCRLVDPSGKRGPSDERRASTMFSKTRQMSSELMLFHRSGFQASGFVYNDSLAVECTITVVKEPKVTFPAVTDVPLLVPSSDMHEHFGKLLQSQMGADVTFTVSGESFAAHKSILAARSPVFMAEFFGHMKESRSSCVEVDGVAAPAFNAMLHFIYTDTVPELDHQSEEATAMAQHLVAAADRYGLDRLKLICESKLSGGITVDTAAATLALAEQHNWSQLKARCIDYISRSPENLDAVMATEAYKDLEATCPFVVIELLKARHGRKN